MTDTPSVGPFRLRGVFAIAGAAFRARWAPMLVAVFVLGYLPAAAQDWLTPHGGVEKEEVNILHPPPAPPDTAPKATSTPQIDHHVGHLGPWEMYLDAGSLTPWIMLHILCGVAQTGAIASLTASVALREPRPWRRMVRDTAVSLPSLLLIAAIVSVLVLLGGVLFLVPGLILFAAWAVAGPAQVVERAGVTGALRRSAELTRSHRGAILGLVAIWLAADLVLGFVAGLVPAVLGFPGLARVDEPVLGTIGALAYDLLIAALYLELRRAKDGVAVGALEQVFA